MSARGRGEVSSACAIEADDDVDDAQDIGGHGGDLDAAIAASRLRAETKSTQVGGHPLSTSPGE